MTTKDAFGYFEINGAKIFENIKVKIIPITDNINPIIARFVSSSLFLRSYSSFSFQYDPIIRSCLNLIKN